ncbi:hypothetical protein D917_10304 [Trichinella nativa]|uniref:Uncharacterized protein n=1 Tax=Trichinella nativa TaxID=6335 RepID=A0A1Y3EGF6_9BILA|nr:hypothetical protein D917_10304 [Trichinella nativa]
MPECSLSSSKIKLSKSYELYYIIYTCINRRLKWISKSAFGEAFPQNSYTTSVYIINRQPRESGITKNYHKMTTTTRLNFGNYFISTAFVHCDKRNAFGCENSVRRCAPFSRFCFANKLSNQLKSQPTHTSCISMCNDVEHREKGSSWVDTTLFAKSIVGHFETVFPDKMLVRGITQTVGSREITNHS